MGGSTGFEGTSARVQEAAAPIERGTGVHRGLSLGRSFLPSPGRPGPKVGGLPTTLHPDGQEAFQKNEWESRLEAAKAGQRDVFFVEADHGSGET